MDNMVNLLNLLNKKFKIFINILETSLLKNYMEKY